MCIYKVNVSFGVKDLKQYMHVYSLCKYTVFFKYNSCPCLVGLHCTSQSCRGLRCLLMRIMLEDYGSSLDEVDKVSLIE